VALPVGTLVIDGSGRHVWPGMVALGTALGLFEIGSVPATMDTRPAGGNQPDLRVAASINADTAHIPVTRANGITRGESCPESGGPLRGQSAVIRLAGETWEELVIDEAALLHLSYPAVANTAEDKDEGDAAEELRQLFADARDYARLAAEAEEHGSEPPAFDPRLEALAPYARGEARIALHADNAQTILYAIRFAQQEGLDVALYGAREGWKVSGAIAASGFAVVVGPVLALPSSRFDPYDSAYANAAVLRRAGCEVSLMAADRSNQRNLPFHAAMAAAFGLPREEALRAISWYPARVLGISDDLGSLRPGKLADLVVTDGDLLEITSHVEQVVIDGRPTSLATRQTDLYDRYRERLLRLTSR
jgi:imidazolonepropionase-like amidohydrolase